MRDHRKETAKGAKIYSAAVAATTEGHAKGDEKVKLHTHSYCCLDYAQIYDVVRYRLHRMKKKLKDELEDKNTIQEYLCPNCKRRYNALDALRLVSMEDEYFHCENCNGELVPVTDKLTSQEVEDGDDNARRRRREKLKDMLQRMEVQLKPLTDQITRVKDLKVPEFGSLQAWEARAALAARGLNGDSGSDDPSRPSQGMGTPMPFLGETKVEVNLGEGKEEDIKSENTSTALKVLPPWMIKQGMNLTKEQRGEVKQEAKADGSSSTASEFSDDKKSAGGNEDGKNLQDEYVKAYYAALLKKQQELAEASNKQESTSTVTHNVPSDTSSDREVGMKSKREEDEEEDVEWEEETPVPATTTENYKVGDLNVVVEASGEEDDDVDWEEG